MVKNYAIKYSIEFVVIILGITVSFWFNALSIENQDEKERIKVLSSLQLEINEIKFYCSKNMHLNSSLLKIKQNWMMPLSKNRMIWKVYYPDVC